MRAGGRRMAPQANGTQFPPRSSTETDRDLFKRKLQSYLHEFWRALLLMGTGLQDYFPEMNDAFWWTLGRLLQPHLIVQYVYAVGWQAATSWLIIRILMAFDGKPLKNIGVCIEAVGIWILRMYMRVKNWILGQSKVAANKTYDLINRYPLTLIGLLDSDFNLDPHTVETFPAESPSARTNAEVCAMAAKVIYENDDLVKEVIEDLWNKGIPAGADKFDFIDWYNYKTQGKNQVDTQAMLFKKGHAVVVVFRGTEPFSAVDWSTDFRFTWWDGIPKLGRVHTGFLESLGLGSPMEGNDSDKTPARTARAEDQKLQSFAEYINLCLTRYRQEAKRRDSAAGRKSLALFRKPESVPTSGSAGTATTASPDSGVTPEIEALGNFLNRFVLKDQCQVSTKKGTPLSQPVDPCNKDNWKENPPLYWQIRLALENLLTKDPEAKIYIAGHSLGGALAAMFTGLLTAEDDVMTERIGGLYTFGQPRVGDWSFAWYLHNKLNLPELRFVRLIYSNDLVPRVPFDDPLFQYKHLGPFHWADAFYNVTVGTFNDQPALGMVTPYLTAIVEVLYNVFWNIFANLLMRDKTHKRPYESPFQILARMGSIFVPRIGAHNPTNYLNAVRYGFPQGKHKKKPPTV